MQRRSGNDRLAILRSQQSSKLYSSAFEDFLESVLEIEGRFREDLVNAGSPYAGRPREAGLSTSGVTAVAPVELQLPIATSLLEARSGRETHLPCADTKGRPRQASYPIAPRVIVESEQDPGLDEEPAQIGNGVGSTGPQHKIARRPVARASTSPMRSVQISPQSPQTPTWPEDRRRSLTMPTPFSPRRGRRTGTRELFTQASRSLSTLTYEFENGNPPDDRELPPPYVEHASNAPRQDVKRPHAGSVSSTISQNTNTFALIQDNLQDRLLERVKQGKSINEVDPLTMRTALMEAVQLEHAGVVEVMLTASNQVHQKDLNGDSALHFAALQGNAAICKALLDSGASVEDHNRNGDTPISLCARGGHTDAVDLLLNSWTIQRGTAAALTKGYLESLKSGNVNTVAAFVERHIKPKKIKESVLCAAEGGSVPALDFILAQKASLKERNPEGWSALHFAAENGHIAMVEKLLALGLSWKAQTKKVGENALAIAIRNRQTATALSLILHKGAQVSRFDKDRVSPLHHAVRIGDLGLMSALLNAGAKLDAQSRYGWTVMHTAVAYGHTHIVAELITRGVSIEERLAEVEFDPAKKTNEGARRGYWAEIRWPHKDARPLHLSLEFGHDEVANLLIAAGAKVEAEDSKGWRPLHYASFSARASMVELLLGKGVSPHATTTDNNTALSLGFRTYGLPASEEDKVRVWELLQGAMNATKKSKLRKFSDFMSGSSAGRQVEKRDRIWHTAELAASLHLEEQPDDGASEGESELTFSTHEQGRDEMDGQEVGRVRSSTGFAQDAKASLR